MQGRLQEDTDRGAEWECDAWMVLMCKGVCYGGGGYGVRVLVMGTIH
jgi:hypothetical protein